MFQNETTIMNKTFTQFFFLLLILVLGSHNLVAQQGTSNPRFCPTFEIMEQHFQSDPAARARYNNVQTQLETITNQLRNQNRNTTEALVTIPVVVHVLLNSTNQSLVTDAIIQSQLDTLNFYFGNQPTGDSLRVYPPFRTSYGRTSLGFCMSQRKPDGTATNGINRVITSATFGTSGPHPGSVVFWDPTKYMNIWVCSMTGGILGYSYTPGAFSPSDSRNGFVNDYRAFGPGPGSSSGGYHYNEYNGGKTAVHEIGHFFNLAHTWGPNNNGNPNCTLSDGCDDTPPTAGPFFGCPSAAPVLNACSPSDPGVMWQNHMDYADDRCMVLFTNDQANRVNASLASPDRIGLTTSDACQPPVPNLGFTFNSTAATTVACPAPAGTSVTLGTTVVGTFTTPITLTQTGIVAGGPVVSFTPAVINPGSATVVTLTNAGTLPNGTYVVNVQGVAGTVTQTTTVTFVISAGITPTLNIVPNLTVCAGSTASFSVTASGAAVTAYQWQVSVNSGASWTNVSTGTGGTTSTYTTQVATAALNGYQYRVLATGQCGVTTSNAAILTLQTAPAITTQPQNAVECAGNNAVFTVAATGTNLTYQWEFSTDGVAPYTTIAGATGSSYTLAAVTLAQNNYRYRVNISGTCPAAITSAPAILNVGNAAAITTQPAATAVCVGQTATFTVAATGSSLTYQWQQSTDGGVTFTNVPGAATSTLSLPATVATQNGYRFRVNVLSCTPTPITSNAATLTVNTLAAINTQPMAVVLCEGSNATFTVGAVGTGLSYQWQVATTGCAGSFTNITGATTNTLTLSNTQASQSGNAYRVIVTGTCNTVTSACVTITVNTAIVVTTQPTSTSACLPDQTSASFSVAVTGTAPTYQWQVSTNGGTSWSNITGAINTSLTLNGLTASMTANQYRVVLNGTCTSGLNSNAATLTVNTKVAITTQPADRSICAGASTSFNVVATGSTITYQWEVSVNNGPFVPVSNAVPFTGYTGATTATLGISNATTTLNGYRYRVIVSGVPCGSVTSSIATLTVNPLPSVVLVAAEYNRLTPYVNTTLFTTVSPAGFYFYQFKKDGVVLNTSTSSSLPVNIDGFGEYEVTVTDINSCSSTSNKVRISDSASNMLFVYPNPTTGQFQVRYYRANTSDNAYSVIVYDGRGSRVSSKQFPIAAPYSRMDVNLNNASAGIYMLEVRDAQGKRLASSSVIVTR